MYVVLVFVYGFVLLLLCVLLVCCFSCSVSVCLRFVCAYVLLFAVVIVCCLCVCDYLMLCVVCSFVGC